MKFGLKLWSTNTDLIDQAVHLIDERIFDYIELTMLPESTITPFLIDIPYIIHIPHEKFGVNPGDTDRKEYTLQMIRESITWADHLNALYLILHAGHGSMESAKDLLREVSDSRLLIENVPKVGLGGEAMIGYSTEQINDLIGSSSMGLCLDFGHAVKAAVSMEMDYKVCVQDFMELEPKVFHVSDGRLDNERDEHLGIGEGEYDIGFFLRCIKANSSQLMTLETQRTDKSSLHEDIQNLNRLNALNLV